MPIHQRKFGFQVSSIALWEMLSVAFGIICSIYASRCIRLRLVCIVGTVEPGRTETVSSVLHLFKGSDVLLAFSCGIYHRPSMSSDAFHVDPFWRRTIVRRKPRDAMVAWQKSARQLRRSYNDVTPSELQQTLSRQSLRYGNTLSPLSKFAGTALDPITPTNTRYVCIGYIVCTNIRT